MPDRIQRIFRATPLSPAEIARDAKLRALVEEEFPPADPELSDVAPSELCKTLRDSIADSGKSIDMIAKETGLPTRLLQQFVTGKRDIRVSTLEKIATHLGLKIVAIR